MKTLPSIDNLDSTAVQVFGTSSDKRASKLKQSVQYYLNGTKDGFLRYRPHPAGKSLKYTYYIRNLLLWALYSRLHCKWSVLQQEAP